MRSITILLGLMLSWGAYAGQGVPLPWPFPWAKDCEVDWKSMQGEYTLTSESDLGSIDIRISVISEFGFKLVHISRYDTEGKLIAGGFNFVSKNQKVLRLYMFPIDSKERLSYAVIKLHYQSKVISCAQDQLVPILTVEAVKNDGTPLDEPAEYRLVRKDPN